MFSDHLSCDSVPLAFALGAAPDQLPALAPRDAGIRLGMLDCAQFRSSDLLQAWREHPQVAGRAFSDFLASPFDATNESDQILAHQILSDLFFALVGKSLLECASLQICSYVDYHFLIRHHEPDHSKHRGLSYTDGCFVGGYVVLIRADRPRIDQPSTPKTWSSILRCGLHEIGHRVYWPTEENYIGSELAAEYFAYSAWNRLRQEALSDGSDIGICRASQDSNYRRISLAAEALVGIAARSCERV